MEKKPEHRGNGVAILAAGSPAVARYLADLLAHTGIETVPSEPKPALLIGYDSSGLFIEKEQKRTSINLPVRASKLAVIIKRMMQGEADQKLAVGPYQLMPQDYLLLDENGQGMRLTEKEAAILSSLHRRKGGAISRQDLLDEVWSYAQGVETHTLETHIYRLRQKIEKDPSQPQILITTDNGYALGV